MLRHVDECIRIRAPLEESGLRLRNFFRAHVDADGLAARIVLRIRLVPLSRARRYRIIATMRPEPHRLAGGLRYRVGWAPEFPGAYPAFAGELCVTTDADVSSFSVTLHGSYRPRHGYVGMLLDAAVGRSVAFAATRELLRLIALRVAEDFHADEARKQNRDKRGAP